MIDQRSLIITTSSFTPDAINEAKQDGKTPISLIDGDKFIDLMILHELGISKKTITYLEIDLEKILKNLKKIRRPLPVGRHLLWRYFLGVKTAM